MKKELWPGWETVRLIGRGSFGSVYEIERDVLVEREKAALKVISIPQNESDISEMYSDGYDDESITSTFKEHLKSIVAEYSLMRKLNGSSNVVNCDDVRYVQHDDGIGWDIFIKMELLTPLTDALPAEIPEEQVLKIAKDLCRALVQCKQFGIIHRDIKPQNIFVSPLGDYKLGDFGIAKTVEKTSGGTKIGTYKYMAPEVYNNQPYGAGADIYSLGLVLYWLLNERRMPFLPLPPEKLRAGMEEQARLRRFSGELIPPPAHGSEELKRIVLKACAFDPKDRFQSAEEMLRDLNALTGERITTPPHVDSDVQTLPEGNDEGQDETVAVNTFKGADTSPFEVGTETDKTVGVFDSPKAPMRSPIPDEGGAEKPFPDKPLQKMPRKKAWPMFVGALAVVVILGIVGLWFFHNSGSEASLPIQANTTIAAGIDHTVGIKADGSVVAVGKNDAGQCDVSGWTNIVAVTAGERCTVGIKADGSVVAMGDNSVGQCDVSDWTDIVDVATSGHHTVGLKADGSVVAVGDNSVGQCDVSDWTDIVDVAAGAGLTVGLKADGSVVAAGLNEGGQCEVSGWTDIVAVAAGDFHTVGLKADGSVVAVGDNFAGQCDVSDWTNNKLPYHVEAGDASGLAETSLRKNNNSLSQTTFQNTTSDNGTTSYTTYEHIGVYTTSAMGIFSEITVETVADAEKIYSVTVLSHNETPELGGIAAELLPEQIVKAQSADVDGIAGATMTSDAIKAAVKEALTEAGFQK